MKWIPPVLPYSLIVVWLFVMVRSLICLRKSREHTQCHNLREVFIITSIRAWMVNHPSKSVYELSSFETTETAQLFILIQHFSIQVWLYNIEFYSIAFILGRVNNVMQPNWLPLKKNLNSKIRTTPYSTSLLRSLPPRLYLTFIDDSITFNRLLLPYCN